MPEKDGDFLRQNTHNENNGRCYYKIQFSENSNIGIIDHISGEGDKMAINRYDAYLKPVCNLENYQDLENAWEIVQLKEGEVLILDNKFIVNKNKK